MQIAAVTICVEEPQSSAGGSDSESGANRLDTITEGESIVKQRMRQFNANISYERNALNSTGTASTYTIPSTANPFDHPNDRWEQRDQSKLDFSTIQRYGDSEWDRSATNIRFQQKIRRRSWPNEPTRPTQDQSKHHFFLSLSHSRYTLSNHSYIRIKVFNTD